MKSSTEERLFPPKNKTFQILSIISIRKPQLYAIIQFLLPPSLSYYR